MVCEHRINGALHSYGKSKWAHIAADLDTEIIKMMTVFVWVIGGSIFPPSFLPPPFSPTDSCNFSCRHHHLFEETTRRQNNQSINRLQFCFHTEKASAGKCARHNNVVVRENSGIDTHTFRLSALYQKASAKTPFHLSSFVFVG